MEGHEKDGSAASHSGHTILKTVTPGRLTHRGKDCIRIDFPYDKELIAVVKTIPGSLWSQSQKCWYVENTPASLGKIMDAFRGKAEVDVGALAGKKPVSGAPLPVLEPVQPGKAIRSNPAIPVLVDKLRVKRYSESTVRTYKMAFPDFLKYFQGRNPEEINENEIRSYLLHLVSTRRVSASYQNQCINAIKFYYEKVLGREKRSYWMDRPVKEHRLPSVLSEDEVKTIFRQISNIKHKCILLLIYSAGLRISEAVNMRIADIDAERRQVIIRAGKGKKDRVSILSGKMPEVLRQYFLTNHPAEWLFEGQYGGQYSARSIQQVFRAALRKAGIRKHATVHTLRHSGVYPAS